MKQYTLPEQTAKLIELGFEKPKNTQYIQRAKARNLHSPFIEFGEPEFEGSYSIGEMIEMLPNTFIFEGVEYDLCLSGGASLVGKYCWQISYIQSKRGYIFCSYDEELIDALYKIVIRLKDKGVI